MPSTGGVIKDGDDFENVLGNKTNESENTVRRSHGAYNLRSVARLQYSNEVSTTMVDSADDSLLSKSLKNNDPVK